MKQTCISFLLIFAGTVILSWAAIGQSGDATKLLHDAEQSTHSFPERAMTLADFVLKSSPEPEQNRKAKSIKASAYSAMGRSDLAMEFAFEAIYDALSLDELAQIETQLFACHIFHSIQIPTKSTHFPALKAIANNSASSRLPNHIRSNIALETGQRLLIEGDTAGALESLKFARRIDPEINLNAKAFSDPTLEIVKIFVAQGNPDSAKVYLSQIQGRHMLHPETNVFLAEIHYLNGMVLIQKSEYSSAISHFNKALIIASSIDNAQIKVRTNFGLLRTYKELRDAQSHRNATEEMYKASASLEEIQSAAINVGHTGMIKLHEANLINAQALQARNIKLGWILLSLITIIAGLVLLRSRATKQRLSDIISYIEASKKIRIASPAAIESAGNARTTSFSKSTEELLFHGLNEFEQSEKFLSKEMSLAQLASLLDTNTKYLSEFINQYKGKNFNTYINELRVAYIIEKLRSNPTYLNYKVSYLADESGFSSHSNFTTVFKAITGISPVKYISLIEKEKENKFIDA